MNILIVGVKYPPETFLLRRYLALGKKGCRFIVYAHGSFYQRKLQNILFKNLAIWDNLTYIQRIIYVPYFLITKTIQYSFHSLRILDISRRQAQSLRDFIIIYFKLIRFAKEKPNIIHFEWLSAAVEYEGLMEFFNVPVVISCRGSQVNSAFYNAERKEQTEGFKRVLEKADAVHCVSNAILKELERLKISKGNNYKFLINRPAVDTEFFYPKITLNSEKSEFLVITSVGSLIWLKGYEYALEAIKILVNRGLRNVQYRIIGDGPEKERILFAISDMELETVVKLLGPMNEKSVRDNLWSTDVFLLSSVSEGISNSVIEAMACGLPVIVTDCGGMKEVVKDGVEGFIVSSRSPEEIANKLELLLKDGEIRFRTGSAARKKAVSQFDIERQVNIFMELYCEQHNSTVKSSI